MATGVIPPSKFGLTLETQTELGLLIQNDGMHRRAARWESFEFMFIITDDNDVDDGNATGISTTTPPTKTTTTHEIVTPFNGSEEICLDDIELEQCTRTNESGKRGIRIVDLPTVRRRIDYSCIATHVRTAGFGHGNRIPGKRQHLICGASPRRCRSI